MSTLLSLQEAIAGLNKEFGGGQVDDNIIRTQVFKQPKYVNKNKKWAKVRAILDHNKSVSYKTINCNAIKKALMADLDYNRFEFIIPNFYYQGAEMDLFALVHNKVVEFEIKTELQDFGNDFRKVYMLGRNKVNKHSFLEAGKALPNFFYFVAPMGMLVPDDVPGHCGLIAAEVVNKPVFFTDDHGRRLPTGEEKKVIDFNILKAAPVLKPARFPDSIYKHIATKCYQRYRQLSSKLILANPELLTVTNEATTAAGN